MRNTRIYVDQPLSCGLEVSLDSMTSKYLGSVLRLTAGDVVTLFNGEGGEFEATIQAAAKKIVTLLVGDYIEANRESPLGVHLGIGLSRGDRMDWVIQKSTEVGVTEITPLITQRSEVKLIHSRVQKKLSHWRKISVSACEQSRRTKIPRINPPLDISRWIDTIRPGKRIVLNHQSQQNISNFKNDYEVLSVSLLVGPEGGLTAEEVQLANHAKFDDMSLGPRILRTETAPVVAISLIQGLWGDFS